MELNTGYKKNDSDDIQLTFWFPDGIKHFNTNYKNLFKMLDNSDKELYDSKPLEKQDKINNKWT